MSLYRRRIKKKVVSEINVVPYIDVMLVLLVVFMVSAPLLNTGVEIELPKAEAPQIDTNPNTESFIIILRADGSIVLNDNTEPIANLNELFDITTKVVQRRPETPFLIKGDRDSNYAEAVKIVATLAKANVPSVYFMTNTP